MVIRGLDRGIEFEIVYDTMEKTAILTNEEMKTKQIKQKEAAERKQVRIWLVFVGYNVEIENGDYEG